MIVAALLLATAAAADPVSLCGRAAADLAGFSAALAQDVRAGRLERVDERDAILSVDSKGKTGGEIIWAELKPGEPAAPAIACLDFDRKGLRSIFPKVELRCEGDATACKAFEKRFAPVAEAGS